MEENYNMYRCDCNTIHEDVVLEVRDHMPAEDTLMDLADTFKVFQRFHQIEDTLCTYSKRNVRLRYFSTFGNVEIGGFTPA